jgi:hypothetical protein
MRPRFARILIVSLATVSCGGNEPCVPPPCPAPIAAIVRISAGGTEGSLTNAFVKDARNGGILAQCSGSPAVCSVSGEHGTYELEIGAPGFRSVTRSISVSGTDAPKCSCPQVVTQNIDVTLVRS